MKIIDEYRMLTEEIAVINSKITTTNREINKLLDTYKPSSLKAINYEDVSVQTSRVEASLLLTTDRINKLKKRLKKLEEELRSVTDQRDKIEKTINEYGNLRKKVIMLRIKGHTIEEVASELNYSTRHIDRLICEIKSMS